MNVDVLVGAARDPRVLEVALSYQRGEGWLADASTELGAVVPDPSPTPGAALEYLRSRLVGMGMVAQPSGDTGESDAQAVEDERWLEEGALFSERMAQRRGVLPFGASKHHATNAARYCRILARLRGSPVPAVEGG